MQAIFRSVETEVPSYSEDLGGGRPRNRPVPSRPEPDPDRKTCLYVATLDTRHFSFTALGWSEDHARHVIGDVERAPETDRFRRLVALSRRIIVRTMHVGNGYRYGDDVPCSTGLTLRTLGSMDHRRPGRRLSTTTIPPLTFI